MTLFPDKARHTSHTFDRELEDIHERIIMMGDLAVQHVTDLLDAIGGFDLAKANRVDASDADLNQLELGIDSSCTDVLARRSPNAVDLRFVLAAIRFVADCERIGDETSRVARHLVMIESQKQIAPFLDRINLIGQAAIDQVRTAIKGYRLADISAAYEVFRMERDLDADYRNHLTWLMKDVKDEGDNAKLFMFNVLHAFERIGDHSVNMAEQVVYMVEGVELRHDKETEGGVAKEDG